MWVYVCDVCNDVCIVHFYVCDVCVRVCVHVCGVCVHVHLYVHNVCFNVYVPAACLWYICMCAHVYVCTSVHVQ